MLVRLVLGAFGVLYLLFTRPVVDAVMRAATENDADVELRPWVYTVARLEGLVLAVWALRGVRRAARSRRAQAATTAASSTTA